MIRMSQSYDGVQRPTVHTFFILYLCIMRLSKLITALPFLIYLLAACGKPEDQNESTPPPTSTSITIPETENIKPVLSSEGGEISISFNSSGEWTASIINTRADSWCDVSPKSGKAGDCRITIKVQRNDSYDERNATIQIKSGDIKKDIVVTQKQKDALSLTSSKVEIDADGGSFSIEVNTNMEFTYSIDEAAKSWITHQGTKALSTKNLSFSVSPNEGIDKREGIITITAEGISEVFHVYQAGETPSILITQSEYYIGCEGGQIVVEVKSNVSVSMSIPNDCDWVEEIETKSISTNTFTLSIAENTNVDGRDCVITFNNSENKLSESISVTQAQKNVINIEKTEYIVGSQGEVITIDIQSNVDYSYSFDVDWIKSSETKAISNTTLQFLVLSNTQYESREGFIHFSYGENEVQFDVKVTQEGAKRVESIILEQSTYNMFAGQETLVSVRIVPEDAYYQSINWSSDDPSVASVSTEGLVKALVKGHTTIRVSCGGISNSCEVHVSGTANCYLVSAPGTYYIPLVKGKTKTKIEDVSSVAILWESFGSDVQPNVGDVLNSVALENGMIKYTTPSVLNNGNALIAAYNSKGKIVWSWHIWICENYVPEDRMCKIVDNDNLSFDFYSRDDNYFMDRNVGATSATPGVLSSLGLYYEWGRKDPFIGPIATNGDRLEMAKIAGKPFGVVTSNQYVGTVEYAIENPTTIIETGYNTSGDWFYLARMTSFWGADIALYDPCPEGWTVPTIYAWYAWVEVNQNSSGFITGPYTSTHDFDSVHYGMSFGDGYSTPTIWYPATGTYSSSMGFQGVGGGGTYWSRSTDGDWGGSYAFNFNTTQKVNAHYDATKASLYPVRCIREK